MKLNFWEAVQAMKNGKVVTSDKSCIRDESKEYLFGFMKICVSLWLRITMTGFGMIMAMNIVTGKQIGRAHV